MNETRKAVGLAWFAFAVSVLSGGFLIRYLIASARASKAMIRTALSRVEPLYPEEDGVQNEAVVRAA